MSLNAAALSISVALFLGWHVARWVRAGKDLASAKDNVEDKVKALWAARRGLAVIGLVALFMAVTWVKKHGG